MADQLIKGYRSGDTRRRTHDMRPIMVLCEVPARQNLCFIQDPWRKAYGRLTTRETNATPVESSGSMRPAATCRCRLPRGSALLPHGIAARILVTSHYGVV